MGAQVNYYGKLFNSPDVTPGIARAANIAKTYGLALVKARTPVDTGDLKAGWQAKLEGNGIRWTNEKSYAGFVEFGTKKMAPRSMLTNSLIDIEEVFTQELYSEIGKELGASTVSSYTSPGYGNAVTGSPKFPEVGKNLQPKIRTGLSKRTPKTSKEFLFSNPKDILNGKQKRSITRAKPLLQRGQG